MEKSAPTIFDEGISGAVWYGMGACIIRTPAVGNRLSFFGGNHQCLDEIIKPKKANRKHRGKIHIYRGGG